VATRSGVATRSPAQNPQHKTLCRGK
jgi:hypothetical protein